ncbi:MAG TPA: SRPBCC family protein [Micromonosporaceae bacterium]|nr:SRPBCC family protein [Micromonosporaceae bacterium]
MTERTITTTLPSDTEITMSRTFDAPRHLVWAAMTQPQHIKRWWGRGNELDVTLDFRPGGSYRYVEHAEDGNDYAFRGEIREIVPEERVVQTFEFEGMPGHIAVETMTLEEKDGKTVVTSTSSFSNKEDRDGMLNSGMQDGAKQSYDALDALLAELQR